MNDSKHVFITGGSSGIGLALGKLMAGRGYAVSLAARRALVVAEQAAAIVSQGGRAFGVGCDVSDLQSVHAAVRAAEAAQGPISIAVANAGVGLPSHAAKFVIADAELMVRTNILGMMYLLDATVPQMVERRSGQFVGVASLAGLRGLPATSVYSASKAAMQAFLEASRVDLAPYGIKVTTINPGFIATAMTEKNAFKMPFLMRVEQAAVIMADAIEQRVSVVEFPKRMAFITRLARQLPNAVYDRVMGPYAWRRTDPTRERR
jgi:short-subunit dehydrogenase